MNGPMKDVTVYPDQARGFARLAWKKTHRKLSNWNLKYS